MRREVVRSPVSFERKVERLVGAGILGRLRLGGEQHGAASLGHRLVDQAVAATDRKGVERALPVAGMALQIEQRLHRPAELGVERQGTLRELPRGLRLAFALRLEEQAAQAELLGIARGQHRLEDAARGGAIAGQLRGLGAQQMRERLVGQGLARLAGVTGGERRVACTDGDDAAR